MFRSIFADLWSPVYDNAVIAAPVTTVADTDDFAEGVAAFLNKRPPRWVCGAQLWIGMRDWLTFEMSPNGMVRPCSCPASKRS